MIFKSDFFFQFHVNKVVEFIKQTETWMENIRDKEKKSSSQLPKHKNPR